MVICYFFDSESGIFHEIPVSFVKNQKDSPKERGLSIDINFTGEYNRSSIAIWQR